MTDSYRFIALLPSSMLAPIHPMNHIQGASIAMVAFYTSSVAIGLEQGA